MTATARQPRKLDIETFLAFYETRPTRSNGNSSTESRS